MKVQAGIILFLIAFSGTLSAQDLPEALKVMKEGENEIKKLDGACAKCEAQKAEKKVAGLFDSRTILKLTMRGHFSRKLELIGVEKRQQEATQSKGELEFETPAQKFPVQLERRGWARGGCPVPLLKILWDKKIPEIQGTLFDPLKDNDMRWVSECAKAKTDHRSILLEYLAQRWMELSGFPALRVRLTEVSYVDLDNKGKAFVDHKQYGFFLEPDKDVEKRLNLSVLHLKKSNDEYFEFDFAQNEGSDLTFAIPTILIEGLLKNWDFSIGKNKNSIVLMNRIEEKKKADLKAVGVYAGVLPYDMTIEPHLVLNFKNHALDAEVGLMYNGKSPGFDGTLRISDPVRWKSEFIRYTKLLLPKRQEFLDEIKALPVSMPSNVADRVNAYFDALQRLVDQAGAGG